MFVNYLLLLVPLCVNRESCCGTGELKKLESLHDNFKDPNAECSIIRCSIGALYHGTLLNEFHLFLSQCLYDCVGRKMGIIDTNNKFVKDKYVELTKDIDLEPESREILNRCIDEHKDHASEKGDRNDVGLRLEHCLFKTIQLGCMPENQKNQTECIDVQKFLLDDTKQRVCQTLTRLDVDSVARPRQQ